MTGSRGYDESAQYVAENLGTQPDMSWIDEGGDVADFHPELQGDAMFNRHSAEQLFEGSPLTFEEALDAADEARPSSIAMEEQRPTWNEGDFFGQKFGNRP